MLLLLALCSPLRGCAARLALARSPSTILEIILAIALNTPNRQTTDRVEEGADSKRDWKKVLELAA